MSCSRMLSICLVIQRIIHFELNFEKTTFSVLFVLLLIFGLGQRTADHCNTYRELSLGCNRDNFLFEEFVPKFGISITFLLK